MANAETPGMSIPGASQTISAPASPVADDADPTGYGAVCRVYAGLGWRGCIPVDPADKGGVPKGFTGGSGVDVTPENMEWFAKSKPDHNTGLRLPPDEIGIDVDHYDAKTGGVTLAEGEKRWGALPLTYVSTSRDDGISGIRLFKVPAGTKFRDVLAFPELDLGDIELVQNHHRYVQCWPSTHPMTGKRYRWIDQRDGSVMDTPPAPSDIPELPEAWLDGLPKRPDGSESPLALGAAAPYDVQQALTTGAMSPRVEHLFCEALQRLHHPTTRDDVLTLLRYGKDGDGGVDNALTALYPAYVAEVGPRRRGGNARADWEFREFITGDKVPALLAVPSYGDMSMYGAPAGTPQVPPNGQPVDGGGQPVPPAAPSTTWEPFDLWPYLRGEIELPKPSIGIARSDGVRLLYAGREHAVIGETESGKTWFALQCVAAEMLAGNGVVYVHYEEGDPSSTVERLQLLGVAADVIAKHLRFVAPSQHLRNTEWLDALLRDPAPTLVVHDGVNEAMALHGLEIKDADGAANFRRWLVSPAIRAGATVLSCDHLPKNRDGQGRDAFGSVHKGNALDGARFVMENVEPFGRGMRGASNVFVTKDRPGHLRAHGRPGKVPGKTFIGMLVADDESPFTPFSLMLYAPKDDETAAPDDQGDGLADAMHGVIMAQPDRAVSSLRMLYAAMRDAQHTKKESAYRSTIDDLVMAGRVEAIPGRRGATVYRAIPTAAREKSQ